MNIFMFHEDYLKLFRQMKDVKLTQEEQELLISVENDEWLSVADLEQEIRRYQSYAQADCLTEVGERLETSWCQGKR